MNYIEQITCALSFIEKQITEKVTLDEVASAAGYSKYHFQRLFFHVTGETVGQYISKRRLTEAAKALSLEQKSVTEVAFTYGFDSHEAFTRAFTKRFGLPPSALRRSGKMPRYMMLERMELPYLENIQRQSIEPIYVPAHEALHLVGYSQATCSLHDIVHCWNQFGQTIGVQPNQKRYGVLRYPDAFGLELSFSYFAAMQTPEHDGTDGLESLTLPASSYLVFPHKGPVQNIKLTYQYIYGSWMTHASDQFYARYDFEYYDHHFLGYDHPDSLCFIYIPVLTRE
ncbi:helix-turn-helix domain-containing protein [Brevibacillus sp. HB1.2]|uniref:helix-turn-helix domain-containing protein n=1 Tax=Brevibacillus sp. HB1.2 TaxID=2738807 RepID=UPI00157763B0|nr:helix-turn-helix domain-containing protein [Brevibacillus sp. HB1.2]NTU24273.1 helix-turn-helix domain-containing protein [Brevibacillus sp. HB1.2]